MDRKNRIRLINEFLVKSDCEKAKLWNTKICVICNLKKEAWNDEIYFCEKCEQIYMKITE